MSIQYCKTAERSTLSKALAMSRAHKFTVVSPFLFSIILLQLQGVMR